jgi:hypothetical protein
MNLKNLKNQSLKNQKRKKMATIKRNKQTPTVPPVDQEGEKP